MMSFNKKTAKKNKATAGLLCNASFHAFLHLMYDVLLYEGMGLPISSSDWSPGL